MGKDVTMAYCYATEISYNILTNDEVNDFVTQAVQAVNEKRTPDTRKSIYLIIASITSYYESINQKAPVTDKQLIYEAAPEEIGTALGTVLSLYMDFYHLSATEAKNAKKEKKGGKEKN